MPFDVLPDEDALDPYSVELILQVGSAAGFAMVFALLIAVIISNLGTWYFGIPNSSSHALIGSPAFNIETGSILLSTRAL